MIPFDKIRKQPRWQTSLFILGLITALFSALDIVDLVGEEPRRALVAYEMWMRGDWMQPTLHGWPYYNKPPVFNWLIAIGYQLYGSAPDWIVRLPSLLALLLNGWLLYQLIRREMSEQLARWATVFFLTGGHILFYASVFSGEMDLLVGCLVFAQVSCLYLGFQYRRLWLLFGGSYLLMSIGFLTKGLPPVAFQAITLLALAIYHRQWRWLFSGVHLAGGLLGFGMIGLYFYYYDQTYGNGWLYLLNLVEEASKKAAGESPFWPIIQALFTFPLELLVDLLLSLIHI